MKIIETCCVVLLGIAMSESKIEHEIKSRNEMQNNCCSKFSIITIKVLSDPETVEFTTKKSRSCKFYAIFTWHVHCHSTWGVYGKV